MRAEEDEIFVTMNGEPVVGLDPYVDDDPLEESGLVGVGQWSNPTYFDNLVFVDLDAVPPGASLKPGDINGDGAFNITDPVEHLSFLFSGGDPLDCFTVPGSDPVVLNPAGFTMFDFTGDGQNNITDAVASLTSLFGGGPGHELGEPCALFDVSCVANCP